MYPEPRGRTKRRTKSRWTGDDAVAMLDKPCRLNE
jgi:hypothetical protein